MKRNQRVAVALFACLALLLALVGDCLARSHHPKPKPQSKTSHLSEQNPTAQPSPANFLTQEQITKAITEGVEAAAKQYEANHLAPPPDNSGWLFNSLLVAFNGGLVAVGIVQCLVIFWTLRATLVAANAAKDAVNTQRDEFLVSHRPRIRIKHLWLANDIWNGQEITVNLGIVNYGTAEATLNTMGIRFIVVRNEWPIPFEPHFPDIPGLNIAGQKLPVGVWWKIENIKNGTQLTGEEHADVQNGRSKLYCLGYVSYRDRAENMRITGFCRVLEIPGNTLALAENCRFRTFPDADYEYED